MDWAAGVNRSRARTPLTARRWIGTLGWRFLIPAVNFPLAIAMALPQAPRLSLIVPTRARVGHLRALLASLASTTARPRDVEVVLVVDEDDAPSHAVGHDRLNVRHVKVPPGLTMGALNTAGYAASSGQYFMLLNDDVRARSYGWDRRLLRCFQTFPDGIALVHPNDAVFADALCTFPVVSRTYCTLAGGICPGHYVRYRIDDHIEDVFNLLALAGMRRTVYLPDVVFAHLNTGDHDQGHNGYLPNPEILALDGPRFDATFADRKALALDLLAHIEFSGDRGAQRARTRLEAISESVNLRVPGRKLVQRGHRSPRLPGPGPYFGLLKRVRSRFMGALAASSLGRCVGGTSSLPVSKSRSSR